MHDIYKKLGKKLDELSIRTPWNESLYKIIKALYTPEDAEFIVKMPYGLSDLDRLKSISNQNEAKIKKILDRLCPKGLIVDFFINNKYYYMISPMIIGIFEMTLMRQFEAKQEIDIGSLFHDYLQKDSFFWEKNFRNGEKISILRTIPHEETLSPSGNVEILTYEKASSLIEDSDKFAISPCSCRKEKRLVGKKVCDITEDCCSSFGLAAEYLIRRNLAREVSKNEMLETLAYSKENGLVLNSENARERVKYICHCCNCCCHFIMGIKKFGFNKMIVTSNFICTANLNSCVGCGKCAKACPIDAIEIIKDKNNEKKKHAKINNEICLGCGVCVLKCNTKSISLINKAKRIQLPESTIQRLILQCLERGTLQYQLFDNPCSLGHSFMRNFLGAFLKLSPIKKALMSDLLRSRFLKFIEAGMDLQGRSWLKDL